MRKKMGLFLSVFIVFCIAMNMSAYGYQLPDGTSRRTLTLDLENNEVLLNGKYSYDILVPPYIEEDGTIWIPLREIPRLFYDFSMFTTWNPDTRTAVIYQEVESNTVLSATIDKKDIIVRGQILTMDSAPMMYHDKMYLPLKYILQLLYMEEDSVRLLKDCQQIKIDKSFSFDTDTISIHVRVYPADRSGALLRSYTLTNEERDGLLKLIQEETFIRNPVPYRVTNTSWIDFHNGTTIGLCGPDELAWDAVRLQSGFGTNFGSGLIDLSDELTSYLEDLCKRHGIPGPPLNIVDYDPFFH